jgi:hypothetical protein
MQDSSSHPVATSASTSPDVLTPPTRPVMKVSWQTLKENNVPLYLRDYCAHEWIPLNKSVYSV